MGQQSDAQIRAQRFSRNLRNIKLMISGTLIRTRVVFFILFLGTFGALRPSIQKKEGGYEEIYSFSYDVEIKYEDHIFNSVFVLGKDFVNGDLEPKLEGIKEIVVQGMKHLIIRNFISIH